MRVPRSLRTFVRGECHERQCLFFIKYPVSPAGRAVGHHAKTQARDLHSTLANIYIFHGTSEQSFIGINGPSDLPFQFANDPFHEIHGSFKYTRIEGKFRSGRLKKFRQGDPAAQG